jgi:tyrosyl-tRNA synthetase
MRVSDELMPRYLTLTTGWHPDRIDDVTNALSSGELAPVDGKRLLARTVVDLYHGEGAGADAEAEFDRVFRDHSIPEDVAEFVVDPAELRDGRVRVARLLALAFPGAVPSNKEGRRKIEQGGVRLDGDVIDDADLELAAADLDGKLLQLGRRNWARLRSEGRRTQRRGGKAPGDV